MIIMAYKRSEREELVTLKERDYLTLIEDHIFVRALKISGVLDKDGVMKAIESVMKDARVEIHIKPIKKHYR